MRLQDYDTSKQFTATVISTERITPDDSSEEVREIVMDVGGGEFSIQVGQNLGVLAPGGKSFGLEHHFRLYSVAGLPEKQPDGKVRLPLCVRRCDYIDDYNGERYKGVASNYLCDLKPGDDLIITGPYGLAFEVPDNLDATLILIGAGTGIAPFRGFIKHLYQHVPEYKGHIRLFHGGRTGLDLLYMNDVRNDFALYYDNETFEAITALSQRPHWSDAIDWHSALISRGEEIWTMLLEANTQVYVAGLESICAELDEVFAKVAGSKETWERRKAELKAGKRWVELVF